jgi:hypothetical protein
MHADNTNQGCIHCGGKTAIYGHGSGGRRLKLRCLDCGERFTLAKPDYRQPRGAGSGVIAPPCYARGWRWGAGY